MGEKRQPERVVFRTAAAVTTPEFQQTARPDWQMNETVNDNALELSLANDLREIPRAAERIEEFCEARALAPQVTYAVNLAIDEILTNTISYGYDDDGEHRIDLTVRLEVDTVVTVIADDGRAFDSSLEREPELETSLEERALGGLGLFLVQQVMDGVDYRRTEGRNIVTLRKSLAGEDDG